MNQAHPGLMSFRSLALFNRANGRSVMILHNVTDGGFE